MSHGQPLRNLHCSRRQGFCDSDRRTNSRFRIARLLPLVWPVLQAACNRWIGSEVLLDRTPTGVLDRSPSLDDAGDRCGPTIGRLPEGVSHERARSRRAFR
jgi:hypothetical protein